MFFFRVALNRIGRKGWILRVAVSTLERQGDANPPVLVLNEQCGRQYRGGVYERVDMTGAFD